MLACTYWIGAHIEPARMHQVDASLLLKKVSWCLKVRPRQLKAAPKSRAALQTSVDVREAELLRLHANDMHRRPSELLERERRRRDHRHLRTCQALLGGETHRVCAPSDQPVRALQRSRRRGARLRRDAPQHGALAHRRGHQVEAATRPLPPRDVQVLASRRALKDADRLNRRCPRLGGLDKRLVVLVASNVTPTCQGSDNFIFLASSSKL